MNIIKNLIQKQNFDYQKAKSELLHIGDDYTEIVETLASYQISTQFPKECNDNFVRLLDAFTEILMSDVKKQNDILSTVKNGNKSAKCLLEVKKTLDILFAVNEELFIVYAIACPNQDRAIFDEYVGFFEKTNETLLQLVSKSYSVEISEFSTCSLFSNENLFYLLQYLSFSEHLISIKNMDINEQYAKTYIKRRVHQYNLSKDEMFLYIIKPEYDFDYISSLTSEIFQDIGFYVSINKKNMDNLYRAYLDMANALFYKTLFCISSMSSDMCNQEEFAKQIVISYKNFDCFNEVRNSFFSAYMDDKLNDDARELLYMFEEKYKKEILSKVNSIFPNIQAMHDMASKMQ